MKSILDSLVNARHFKKLILFLGGGKNHVTDLGLSYFEEFANNHPELTTLQLSLDEGEHYVTDEGVKTLTSALKKCTNFESIFFNVSLGKSPITDKAFEYFSQNMQFCTKLIKLDLRLLTGSFAITNKALKCLGDCITHFINLTSLCIGISDSPNLKLTDEGLIYFVNSLRGCKNLEELSTDFDASAYHSITDNFLKVYTDVVVNFVKLTLILLNLVGKGVVITSKGVDYLAPHVEKFTRIRTGFFKFNNYGGSISTESVVKLASHCFKNRLLENLTLGFNGDVDHSERIIDVILGNKNKMKNRCQLEFFYET